ncbi:MAG: YlxR family protein [Eubacteriales bacterium]|nr:YlxR family protein [Eubacteriales bacterium]
MPKELKPKKIPERRCVGCGERKEKRELIRVLRTPEGEIVLDRTGKRSGRGAYLCPNAECLRKARKTRRLQTNLETEIPDSVFEALEREISRNVN